MTILSRTDGERFATRLATVGDFADTLKGLNVPDLSQRNARSGRVVRHETTLTASRLRALTGEDLFPRFWNGGEGKVYGPHPGTVAWIHYFQVRRRLPPKTRSFDAVRTLLEERAMLEFVLGLPLPDEKSGPGEAIKNGKIETKPAFRRN